MLNICNTAELNFIQSTHHQTVQKVQKNTNNIKMWVLMLLEQQEKARFCFPQSFYTNEKKCLWQVITT